MVMKGSSNNTELLYWEVRGQATEEQEMTTRFLAIGVLQLVLVIRSISGQCNFDTRCFRFSAGCTLMNANPYERRAGISCTDCLNRCLQQQKGPTPYCCRAAVYDWRYQTCDLFAVNAMYKPYRLTKCYGRCYFQPTGCCSASTPAPVATTQGPAVSCPSGQTAKLVAIKDYQYPGITGTTIPNSTPEACGQLCVKNQLPDGKSIDCKAAQYGPGTQCVLSTTAGANVEGSVQPSPGATYYQKLCFPTSSVANCPDIFEEDPQKILIGQNRQTIDATSIQDCMQKCLDSQANYAFVCKSGMYFYEGNQLNCILNIESKSTKPDLFTDSQGDKVTYFEPGCNGGQKLAIKAARKSMKALDTSIVKDLPLANEWTLWSPCSAISDKQYRFMPCEKTDPRQCEKEERSCSDSPSSDKENVVTADDLIWMKDLKRNRAAAEMIDGNATSSFTPCMATFKGGHKNCTFGLQTVDGEARYCYDPVDFECIGQD